MNPFMGTFVSGRALSVHGTLFYFSARILRVYFSRLVHISENDFMLQWHSFLFHTYHFLSFKKANSHHGRPCKLDLQQNSTISFYSSSPNRKKSIQHFLLSLSGYCPNSFWKQSSVHRFLRKQGRDAHCHCRRIYFPRCSAPCLGSCSKSSTMCGTSSAPKTNKTRRGC